MDVDHTLKTLSALMKGMKNLTNTLMTDPDVRNAKGADVGYGIFLQHCRFRDDSSIPNHHHNVLFCRLPKIGVFYLLQTGTAHEKVATLKAYNAVVPKANAFRAAMQPGLDSMEWRQNEPNLMLGCQPVNESDVSFSLLVGDYEWAHKCTSSKMLEIVKTRISLFAPFAHESRTQIWGVEGRKVLAETPEGALGAYAFSARTLSKFRDGSNPMEVKQQFDSFEVQRKFRAMTNFNKQKIPEDY